MPEQRRRLTPDSRIWSEVPATRRRCNPCTRFSPHDCIACVDILPGLHLAVTLDPPATGRLHKHEVLG